MQTFHDNRTCPNCKGEKRPQYSLCAECYQKSLQKNLHRSVLEAKPQDVDVDMLLFYARKLNVPVCVVGEDGFPVIIQEAV